MKNLLFISLLTSFVVSQQTTSYSWEDGMGTILGSYNTGGNIVVDEANVGTTSGISPYDGSRMLTVSESPLGGTPQAFIAWVTDLSANQSIEVCFYGYDNTPNGPSSLRIWGSWSANNDIEVYDGSADGGAAYTNGEDNPSDSNGWSQVCHTFSTNHEHWETGEALVIQARLYSGSQDPTVYFIDLVEVTAPNSVTVNYPGGTQAGCINPTACNYAPYATEDDGSCVYPEGSISICDIQYTTDAGDYCYESPYDQQCWITTGTVMAEHPLYSNFYLQDETCGGFYNGIYVHGYSATTPILGENITITATINEYYSLTQLIDGASFSVNSSGNTVEPTDILTGDLANGCNENGEPVESMLVRISNVEVTQTSNEYGEWLVDDGSGAVMINDKIFDGTDWPDPTEGCQEFASIVGVVDYAYSTFSILPRTMSDIAYLPGMPQANAEAPQSTAPNSVVTLDGSNSVDPGGYIAYYEWIQTDGIPVDLLNNASAVATFTAPGTASDLIIELTVYDNENNVSCDEVKINVENYTQMSLLQFTTTMGNGDDECYPSPYVDSTIVIGGIVTAVKPGEYPNFYLQEQGANSWGGIYVYDTSVDPSVGDQISINATVEEYFGCTQLNDVTSSTTFSTDNLINPITISTGDLGLNCSFDAEGYEGMLIRVTDVEVEGVDEHGNWIVNDGTGQTKVDDYFFEGDWPTNTSDISTIAGVVQYSYEEFKILPRNISDFDDACPYANGDVNNDSAWDVLDIVLLANCVVEQNCSNLGTSCAADVNYDNIWNVLDIVQLANCVVDANCSGRIDDATNSKLIMRDNMVLIETDGFIGGVQMTLQHGDDFSIKMTDMALVVDYLTTGNETRLIVITPETEELFSYNGNFEITEVIVANSQIEIPTLLPAKYNLSVAYPNPFNPITSMEFTIPEDGNVNVQVYNLKGQAISTLLSGHQVANTYYLTWEASHVPSGIYFVKAESAEYIQTQKLMLIK